MKFSLSHNSHLACWELTLEGHEDSVVDLLVTYCGGDHEQALDLFELSIPVIGAVVRVTVDLAGDIRTEQAAAKALLDLLTNTPGFSHG
jgi:hypothetical protein